MDALSYEEIVGDFQSKLVTQLRSHGSSIEYLEMWVPDADPVRSILNMIEAAQAYGQSDLKLRVGKSTLSAAQIEELRAEAASLASVSIAAEEAAWLVSVDIPA
jgi:hypothetical protein